MNRIEVTKMVRELKQYVDEIELELSRPNPKYTYIQFKIDQLPKMAAKIKDGFKRG